MRSVGVLVVALAGTVTSPATAEMKQIPAIELHARTVIAALAHFVRLGTQRTCTAR